MMNLSAFMRANPLPALPEPPVRKGKRSTAGTARGKRIPEGKRNATLSRFAGQMVIKYGIEDGKARTEFLDRAADCEPPLDDKELEIIWRSALKFFAEKRSKKAGGWKSPAEYIGAEFAQVDTLNPADLIPEHFTDVEQAKTLARLYGDQLRYSDAIAKTVRTADSGAGGDAGGAEHVHGVQRHGIRQRGISCGGGCHCPPCGQTASPQ